MATTDQLQKAARFAASGKVALNDFRALAYRRALQSHGVSLPPHTSKLTLFKMVVERGIDMRLAYRRAP